MHSTDFLNILVTDVVVETENIPPKNCEECFWVDSFSPRKN